MSILAKPYPCAFGCLQYHSGLAGLVLLNPSNWLSYNQEQLSTWLWKAGAWSLLQTGITHNPAPRTLTSMAFDGTSMVQFGGKNVPGLEYMNDTNLLSAAGVWSNAVANYNKLGLSVATVVTTLNNSTFPPTVVNTGTTNLGLNIRAKAYMAAISTGVLLMGGEDYNQLMYQQQFLWTHGSNTWTQQFPATLPTIRSNGAFCSDGSSNVVLFGGAGTSWLLNDLWLYTTGSATWTKCTSNTGPSCRRDAVMAWFPTASAFILMGGEDSSGDLLGDVWKLTISGTVGTWTKLTITNTAANQPARRSGAQFAYDTTSSQLILFGGAGTGSTLFADTWQLTVSGSTATWALLANAL